METIRVELLYIGHYFYVQFMQIWLYWVLGMLIGSFISVFAKDKIHNLFGEMAGGRQELIGLIPASMLGILSPLCMYGTIPIAASFKKQGMKDDLLASFMMSSILLNPQLVIYSSALGVKVMLIRIISCFLCGVCAGLAVHYLCRDKEYFDFKGFDAPKSRDTHPNLFIRYLKNLGRNMKATGGYFLIGILLSALFQRYVPSEGFAKLFGSNEGFGVLMAATIGVPLYACGGGTIPLLQAWIADGMSLGSATAFMITGPATKITNLGALKIVLGLKNFLLYFAFILLSAFLYGLLVNVLL